MRAGTQKNEEEAGDLHLKTRFHGQMSDTFHAAVFVTLSGGFQDAYTYICRGQVFANAQTGNIVLLSAALLRGDWAVCLRYAIPLLSFVFAVGAGLGSFVTEAADIRAIWVCCGLLLVSFALMFVRDERES